MFLIYFLLSLFSVCHALPLSVVSCAPPPWFVLGGCSRPAVCCLSRSPCFFLSAGLVVTIRVVDAACLPSAPYLGLRSRITALCSSFVLVLSSLACCLTSVGLPLLFVAVCSCLPLSWFFSPRCRRSATCFSFFSPDFLVLRACWPLLVRCCGMQLPPPPLVCLLLPLVFAPLSFCLCLRLSPFAAPKHALFVFRGCCCPALRFALFCVCFVALRVTVGRLSAPVAACASPPPPNFPGLCFAGVLALLLAFPSDLLAVFFCAPVCRLSALVAASCSSPPWWLVVPCAGAAWCFVVPCCYVVHCAPGAAVCRIVLCPVVSRFACGVAPPCVACVALRCYSSRGCALLCAAQCPVALCSVALSRAFCCSACCTVRSLLCCAVLPCGVVGCCVLCRVLWRCVVPWYVTSHGVALCGVAVRELLCAVLCCAVVCCFVLCRAFERGVLVRCAVAFLW